MKKETTMDGFDPKRWLSRQLAWEEVLTRLRAEAAEAPTQTAARKRCVDPLRRRIARHAAGLPQPKTAA
jgi:hypothetical protein